MIRCGLNIDYTQGLASQSQSANTSQLDGESCSYSSILWSMCNHDIMCLSWGHELCKPCARDTELNTIMWYSTCCELRSSKSRDVAIVRLPQGNGIGCWNSTVNNQIISLRKAPAQHQHRNPQQQSTTQAVTQHLPQRQPTQFVSLAECQFMQHLPQMIRDRTSKEAYALATATQQFWLHGFRDISSAWTLLNLCCTASWHTGLANSSKCKNAVAVKFPGSLFWYMRCCWLIQEWETLSLSLFLPLSLSISLSVCLSLSVSYSVALYIGPHWILRSSFASYLQA